MQLAENILVNLKKNGHKLTIPRVEILKILSLENPISSQEAFEVLRRKGNNVDLVTVYRTLELFTDLGFIAKIQFEDKITRYELINTNEHHHHLVCIKCGEIEDIAINEELFVKQIEKKSNFKVQRHALEFYGFCASCQ